MNNLNVDDVPTELGSLKKLKQILIAQRILFEKVIVMPKGQQRKIKGAICNVPVNCDQICKILPRPPDRKIERGPLKTNTTAQKRKYCLL